jgi:hypothetical protein
MQGGSEALTSFKTIYWNKKQRVLVNLKQDKTGRKKRKSIKLRGKHPTMEKN